MTRGHYGEVAGLLNLGPIGGNEPKITQPRRENPGGVWLAVLLFVTLVPACNLGEIEVYQESKSLMQVEVRQGDNSLAQFCGLELIAPELLPVDFVTFEAQVGSVVTVEHQALTVLKRREGTPLGEGDEYWCSDEDGKPGRTGYTREPRIVECMRQLNGAEAATLTEAEPILGVPSPEGQVSARGYSVTLEIRGPGTIHYGYDAECMDALEAPSYLGGTVPHTIEVTP